MDRMGFALSGEPRGQRAETAVDGSVTELGPRSETMLEAI